MVKESIDYSEYYSDYIVNIPFSNEGKLAEIKNNLENTENDIEELEILLNKFHQLLKSYTKLNIFNSKVYALLVEMDNIYDIYKKNILIKQEKIGVLKTFKNQYRNDKIKIIQLREEIEFKRDKTDEANGIINNIILSLEEFNKIYVNIFGYLDTIDYHLKLRTSIPGGIAISTTKILIGDKKVNVSNRLIYMVDEEKFLVNFKTKINEVYKNKSLFTKIIGDGKTVGDLQKFIYMVDGYSKRKV